MNGVPDNKQEHKGVTILVVEDEPAILKLTESLLSLENYNVLTASSLDEAVAWSAKHKNEIDLLITDIRLPEISGVDLAKKLGVDCPQMKIIFMSGQSPHVIKNKGLSKDHTNFVQKPFRPKELLDKIKKTLYSS